MGWWRAMVFCSILPRKGAELKKWIDDPHFVEFLAVLHVFGQQDRAAGLFGHAEDERVPVGEAVESMDVDGGEDVGDFGLDQMEARVHLYLPSSRSWIKAQLPGGIDKILLKYLERNDSCSLNSVLES